MTLAVLLAAALFQAGAAQPEEFRQARSGDPQNADPKTLSLLGYEDRGVPEDALLAPPAAFSALLDVGLFYSRSRSLSGASSSFESRSERLTIDLSPTLRVGGENGVVIESDFELSRFQQEFTDESGPAGFEDRTRFDRISTRATYDWPDQAVRLEAGDIFVTPVNLQNGGELLGVSIGTAYDRLQPTRNIIASGRRSFRLERESQVEVYVNNVFFDELSLQPGQYELTDFPLNFGSNNVELRIRDNAGRVQTLDFSAFSASTLLESGVREWGVHAGFESIFTGEAREYDFNEPAFSMFYRQGISDRVTIGADLQGDTDNIIAAGVVTLATRAGVIDASLGMAPRNAHETGLAGRLRYTLAESGARPGVFLEASAFGDGFTGLNSNGFQNSTEFIGVASVTRSFGSNGFVDLGGDFRRSRSDEDFGIEGGDEWSAFASIGSMVHERFMLDLTASVRGGDFDPETEVSFFASISVSFGEDYAADASVDTGFKERRYGVSRFPRSNIGDPSLNAVVTESYGGDEAILDGFFDARVTDNRFSASASHNRRLRGTEQSGGSRFTSLRAETSLGFADGVLAVGRPGPGAFIIVDDQRTDRRNPIIVQPYGEGNYAARTSGFAPLLLTGVQAYQTDIHAMGSQVALDPDIAIPGVGLVYATRARNRSAHVLRVTDEEQALIERIEQEYGLEPCDGVLVTVDEGDGASYTECRPAQ